MPSVIVKASLAIVLGIAAAVVGLWILEEGVPFIFGLFLLSGSVCGLLAIVFGFYALPVGQRERDDEASKVARYAFNLAIASVTLSGFAAGVLFLGLALSDG